MVGIFTPRGGSNWGDLHQQHNHHNHNNDNDHYHQFQQQQTLHHHNNDENYHYHQFRNQHRGDTDGLLTTQNPTPPPRGATRRRGRLGGLRATGGVVSQDQQLRGGVTSDYTYEASIYVRQGSSDTYRLYGSLYRPSEADGGTTQYHQNLPGGQNPHHHRSNGQGQDGFNEMFNIEPRRMDGEDEGDGFSGWPWSHK